MSAYSTRMPAGFAGDVSRRQGAVTEPCVLGSTAMAPGSIVKLSSGKAAPLAGGEDASAVYGVLTRGYPTQHGVGSLSSDLVPAGAVGDVLRSGYVLVHLASGTAAKGGAVYVRVTAAAGKAVGDIEAVADPDALDIAGAANTGNTGDATVGTLSVDDPAYAGDYAVVMTSATAFDVFDPDGRILGSGVAGTEFSAGGVTFSITAGSTPCVASDGFTLTVTESAPGNVPIPATFQGQGDASGVVEIGFNL